MRIINYLDLDIAAAAIPIGMTRSIHSQFIDESSFGVAGDVGVVTP
jgi:hypothetical protein